tara:strand:- start:93 stop:599 length:507 start_codon:yes stop_codon:yes gene_type:complete
MNEDEYRKYDTLIRREDKAASYDKPDLIKVPERAKQVIDFKGLTYKKMHPMDIDAVFEFDNEYLILVETKLRNANGMFIPYGQQLTLERIADSWAETRKAAIVVYCSHKTESDEVIYLKDTIVESVYNSNLQKTICFSGNQTFKEWLKNLALHWDCKKLMKIIQGDIE